MSNNFKVIKIRVIDGAYSLLGSGMEEITAWAYADNLEHKQMALPGGRQYWYAVTNAGDWHNMAASFYLMRKGSM